MIKFIHIISSFLQNINQLFFTTSFFFRRSVDKIFRYLVVFAANRDSIDEVVIIHFHSCVFSFFKKHKDSPAYKRILHDECTDYIRVLLLLEYHALPLLLSGKHPRIQLTRLSYSCWSISIHSFSPSLKKRWISTRSPSGFSA